jgi:hypothetical protein
MGEFALACIGSAPKEHSDGKAARGVLRSTETINQAAKRNEGRGEVRSIVAS